MIETSKVKWSRRPKLLLRNRVGIRRNTVRKKPDEEIRYPLETGFCIMVFGNRVLCENQNLCYCEFVRDIVNRIVVYRESN